MLCKYSLSNKTPTSAISGSSSQSRKPVTVTGCGECEGDPEIKKNLDSLPWIFTLCEACDRFLTSLNQEIPMSLQSVRQFFTDHAPDIEIIELTQSTATVALAAAAHNVEPGQIAKTLSLKTKRKGCSRCRERRCTPG